MTCPIDLFAHAGVSMRPAPAASVSGADDLPKLRRAALAALDVLRVGAWEIRVEHLSELDTGKGMGSSTADITAVVRAVAAAAGRDVSASEIAGIAASIESSDGSMFPGIVAAEQSTGRTLAIYDWYPQFDIVMLVPAQTLDTASVPRGGREVHAALFDDILTSLSVASKERDGAAFARAASLSAELNQPVVRNVYYDLLSGVSSRLGAAGVVVAHTGTVAGLLFLSEGAGVPGAAVRAASELRGVLPSSVRLELARTPACPAL